MNAGKIFTIALLGSLISSVAAQAWWNPDYTLRKKITIDTTSAGVPITDPMGTARILVRLSADFNFSAAKDDGSDLRLIAADDKTPLAFHLEKFDALLGEAFVWVKVPDLKPGTVTTFYLYYGDNNVNTVASGAPDAKATYDADTALVYHFAEPGKNPHDYSGNNNDADSPASTTDGSFIGSGLRLDGKTLVKIKAADTLNFAEGAALSWSAWIKIATPQAGAVLFSRRDGTRDFLVGVDDLIPFIEINGQKINAAAPLTAGSWTHLAVVADANKATLFVGGDAVATSSVPLPGLSTGMTIGGDPDTAGAVPFVGEMDELEIYKTARPPGLVKLAALEQGGDSAAKLLTVAADEAPPASWLSGSFGLFGVILKSVTIDGWVVIGMLAIMSVVSWYVMFTKFFFLNGLAKGNSLFNKEWRHVASDLTVLNHGELDKVQTLGGRVAGAHQRSIHRSSIYRIYHIGADEIRHRLLENRVLSARSIQAIRASLDGGFVRENQILQSGMVFLTISIAGGPFLGLLGTVVGVMITFAAIAATGEVNINAIAPGIAAALVATVAGLLVAIPALLGYNYLVSQMRNVTSDMQVFIDEFVTKMAEFYSNTGE